MNLNINKAIPEIKFPENKIPVTNPIDEPLVYLNFDFDCVSKYNSWIEQNGKPLPGSSPFIVSRKTVFEKLLKAEKLLPEGYHFRIFDAYRPIAVQQALWDYFKNKKIKENPNLSEVEIDRLVSFCVSFPSYNVLEPSLHNTGGAIDLTILDKDGKELDMGCEFDEFTDKAWTNHFEDDYIKGEKNEVVRDNRRLLYNVMTSVGFTNLPSEWWHFDYGDDKWAQLTKNVPIYVGILDAEIKYSEPYLGMDKLRELDKIQQLNVFKFVEIKKSCKELSQILSNSFRK